MVINKSTKFLTLYSSVWISFCPFGNKIICSPWRFLIVFRPSGNICSSVPSALIVFRVPSGYDTSVLPSILLVHLCPLLIINKWIFYPLKNVSTVLFKLHHFSAVRILNVPWVCCSIVISENFIKKFDLYTVTSYLIVWVFKSVSRTSPLKYFIRIIFPSAEIFFKLPLL